jgi:hypothetical protein
MELWNWLTPVAACVLTVLVAVHGSSRHLPRTSAPDDATFLVMLNATFSNRQQTFVLSKMDENLEWNVWTHPFAAQTAAPDARLNAMRTNR